MYFPCSLALILVIFAGIVEQKVNKLQPPKFRSEIIPERIATINATVQLECRVKGSPTPFIEWYQDEKRLETSNRIIVKKNKLKMNSLRLSDSGKYACKASNDAGVLWGNFTVKVVEDDIVQPDYYDDEDELPNDIGPPQWSLKKDVNYYVARPAFQRVTMNCDAKGYPFPNITWFKDDKRIQHTEKKYQLEGYKLTVEYLNMDDKGNYVCVVQNEYGYLNWTYELEVVQKLAMAPIINDIANQTTVVGDNVTFSCIIVMSDSQPHLQWLKHYKVNDSFLDSMGHPYIVLLQQSGFNKTAEDPQLLVLTNVTEADEGWYTCLVANTVGMNYKTAWLEVLNDDIVQPDHYNDEDELPNDIGAPQWGHKKDLYKYVARSAFTFVTMNCDARGYPFPNITWFKDDKGIQHTEEKYQLESYNLTVKMLTMDDTGNYVCVVQNEYGYLNWSYKLDVIQNLAMAPIIYHIANQTAVVGDNVTFSCIIVTRGSQAHLQWLKHYKVNDSFLDSIGYPYIALLQQSGFNKTEEDPQLLVLTNVTEADEGWYTCLVGNTMGTDYKSAWLDVLNVAETEVLQPFNNSLSKVFFVTHHNDNISKTSVITIAVFCGVITLSITVILIVVCRLRRKTKYKYVDVKRVNVMRLNDLHYPDRDEPGAEPICLPEVRIEGTGRQRTFSSCMTMASEYELPLDSKWEIPRDRLTLEKELGSEDATDREMVDLMVETEMTKIVKGPLYVIPEFAPNGNLRDVLRRRSPCLDYEKHKSFMMECKKPLFQDMPLTEKYLVSYAYQVARGMEYLSSRSEYIDLEPVETVLLSSSNSQYSTMSHSSANSESDLSSTIV